MHFKILLLLYLFPIHFLFGQIEDKPCTFLSPQEFDSWAEEQVQLLKDKGTVDIDKINRFTLERMKRGIFISEDALFSIVKINTSYDFRNNSKERPLYAKTIHFIEKLVDHIYKRDFVKIKLLERKATLLQNMSDEINDVSDKILRTSLSYIKKLDSLNLLMLVIEHNAHYKIGSLLFKERGENELAEVHFREVLGYPFYNVDNVKVFQDLRDIYIKCGLELIQLHRGNLKALRRLYFVPSTKPDLYPVLKLYYEELGEKWDRKN